MSLVELPAMVQGWADSAASAPANPTRPTYARISMPSIVALPFQCDRVWRGARTKTRKLVLNADGKPWLFFDLEQDPLETKNLVNEVNRWEEMAALIALIGR